MKHPKGPKTNRSPEEVRLVAPEGKNLKRRGFYRAKPRPGPVAVAK